MPADDEYGVPSLQRDLGRWYAANLFDPRRHIRNRRRLNVRRPWFVSANAQKVGEPEGVLPLSAALNVFDQVDNIPSVFEMFLRSLGRGLFLHNRTTSAVAIRWKSRR